MGLCQHASQTGKRTRQGRSRKQRTQRHVISAASSDCGPVRLVHAFIVDLSPMVKHRRTADPDRVIAADVLPSKAGSGDANALWRYQKQRRRNLLAKPGPHTVVLVLDGLRADFNVPKIFRSAEAFGAHAVHLIGIGPFDPAPAKGAFRHVPAHFHDDFASCREQLVADDFSLIGLDPAASSSMNDVCLPRRCAFVLGHEARGLSEAVRQERSLRLVSIPQWGPIESLNVAVAASLALYEYVSQHGVALPFEDDPGSE